MESPRRIYEKRIDSFLILSHEELKERYGKLKQCLYLNNNYQILWFKKPLTIFVEDIPYEIRENSICLISKNKTVNFHEGRSEDAEETAIFLSEFLFSQFTSDWSAYIRNQIFNTNSGIRFCIVPSDRIARLEQLIDEMRQEQETKDKWSERRIASLTNLFLLEICRYGELKTMTPVTHHSYSQSLFFRFIDCVDKHHTELHKATEYASLLGVSVDALYKETKSHCGLTPRDIITDKIITESKHQLLYTRKSVKEIATALGFEDVSNFIKLFKMVSDISPNEFRRSEQNQSQAEREQR